MPTKHPLSKEEFDAIFSKVPRLTVEVIVRNDRGEIYLTKRAIEPCKGQWHLPGGTVRYAEPLVEAVKRVAQDEIGLSVKEAKLVGYIEYPSHYKRNLGSPVGIVFEVVDYEGQAQLNEEATDGGWFHQLPLPMHGDQDTFLIDNHYLVP